MRRGPFRTTNVGIYDVLPHSRRRFAVSDVLQDQMKNRKSEVENINGWVVEQQEKQGKAAPVNAAIVEISARIKRGTLEPGLENLELLKKLVERS